MSIAIHPLYTVICYKSDDPSQRCITVYNNMIDINVAHYYAYNGNTNAARQYVYWVEEQSIWTYSPSDIAAPSRRMMSCPDFIVAKSGSPPTISTEPITSFTSPMLYTLCGWKKIHDLSDQISRNQLRSCSWMAHSRGYSYMGLWFKQSQWCL